MIRIRLREMLDAFCARTGERLTYEKLADRTGLARATIESMATRERYNASLLTIERVCRALHCQPGDLLELQPPATPRKKGRTS
ncbi:MAG: helix-turn-helix transcriptional regulator [Hyphomicrobiaceae bacterium]|nr:MAG: helix-turn-helix transcriptional regulator [Hyphomicrobiaceae bacterium]